MAPNRPKKEPQLEVKWRKKSCSSHHLLSQAFFVCILATQRAGGQATSERGKGLFTENRPRRHAGVALD